MERKHMRFLTLLVSLLVLVSVLTTTVFADEPQTSNEPDCYVHGDLNGDGLISSKDAVYLLYNFMLDDEVNYPVEQDRDFNHDDKVSTKDAVYILYASFGDGIEGTEANPLKGIVHDYYAPTWNWVADENGATATLSLLCGCGEPHELVTGAGENDIKITSARTEATCVAAGKIEYTAKVTFDGREFTEAYTVALPVTGDGHKMVGEQGCESKSECELCDFELPALGHTWVLNEEKSTAATCTTDAVQWYDCACGDHKEVTVDGKAPHAHTFAGSESKQVEGTTCEYVTVSTYKCACGDEITEQETYYKHTYTVTLTGEPNCQESGERTYTCSDCGDSYTEAVDPNGVHVWDAGTTENGVTTHKCTVSGCEETKTTVAVAKDEAIANDQLTNELQLENAAISLDEKTVEGLDAEKKIKISVEIADLDNTGLTEDEKAQVGENTVYDFSMEYEDGTAVTNFGGKVTVSLPYTLGENEDIDSIDVWYINDKGEPEQVTGTYSNGYVTFETDHFSYYTVTRLTPAQRCERHGHIEVDSAKAATCTEEGYSMKVCQRCGEELDKTVQEMLGHDYQNTSNAKDPTCTEPGVEEKQCTRCEHKYTAEIPAKGHNPVVDEKQSTAATCTAPGVTVSVCANEGCDYTQTEEDPQLSHQYKGEPIVVDPDCVNKGNTKKKCDLCNEHIVISESAPHGHNYQVAEDGWVWNENKTAATVTLICQHKNTHVREIKAAVTEKIEAAGCTVGGYAVYTATAYHNATTFTDTITVELEATGHQTSGAWESNANFHYRYCSVCNEKADEADHNWGAEEITKQPTCSTSGAASSSCIVCGYTKTETLLATGQHNLVNGTCSVCGFSENNCSHVKQTQQLVEITGHGICEGLVLDLYKCECGERGTVYIYNSGCNFVETGTNEVLPDGTSCWTSVMTCLDCGLSYKIVEKMILDKEECASYPTISRKVSIGDTVLVETYEEYRDWGQSHPCVYADEPIQLSDYGMCEGTLTQYYCVCGKAQNYSSDFGCNFVDEVCTECGVQWIRGEWTETEENCTTTSSQTVTFKKDGKELLSFKDSMCYSTHNYNAVDFQMDGDDCEDGVLVHNVCSDCGEEYYASIFYHERCVKTVTDLTGYGSCAPFITTHSCCCGKYKETFDGEYFGYDLHSWTRVSEDEATGTSIYTCSDCGYTRTDKETLSDKDDNCIATYTRTSTYTDGKGHTYVGVDESTGAFHNMERVFVLKGTSCEDGVQVKQVCSDCGYYYVTQEYSDHMSWEVEEYDLAEYGMCGPHLVIYKCACGEQASHNHHSYVDDENCEWWWIDGEEKTETLQCANCGTIRVEKRETVEVIDDCHSTERVSLTYLKGEEELLTVSYDRHLENHDAFCTFVLNDEAKGCEGGYSVTWTCRNCDWTTTENNRNGHGTYPVSSETISGKLCSDLELITYSCPCGQSTETHENWLGDRCDFQWTNGEYDGGWVYTYTCTKCGAVRTERNTQVPSEDHPCRNTSTWKYTITKGDEMICTYEESWNSYDHSEVVEYQLQGETCDAGYTFSSSCVVCGETLTENSNTYYGCDDRPVEYVTVVENDGICGDVRMQIRSCACGKRTNAELYYDCYFEHRGWDNERECSYYQCTECGLIRYGDPSKKHISGTCTATRTLNYIFELDGEEVGSFQGSYVVEDHQMTTTFNLYGTTCEEGFDVIETCEGCGRTETYEGWGHNQYQIGTYYLSDYGMCSGEYDIYGCACGQERWFGWNSECQWIHISWDEETNTTTNYCPTCKTYRIQRDVGQRDKETCTYTGTESVSFVRDDVTLLNLSVNRYYESHDMYAVSMSLANPEGDCEDGVIAQMKCLDCEYTNTETQNYHRDWLIRKIDLSDKCGGELTFWACACGQNSSLSQEMDCENTIREQWSEYDDEDIEHSFVEEKCTECGLTILTEIYNEYSETGCYTLHHEDYTVTLDGETYTHNTIHNWSNHEYQYTGGELIDGASSCEDGVYVNWQCAKCDETGSYMAESHYMLPKESIDLTPYGSICGGKLDLFTCACGKYSRYDFGYENECDFGGQYTPMWIADVINDSQETAEGWYEFYSNAQIFTCAVSDPVACGTKIRMAEYWLKEGCEATEYQTWQLGYDETDGSYDKEITIATGEKHGYHNYEGTPISETLDDGSVVSGTMYTCPDCGSYYYYRDTHLNGAQTKHEWRYVNLLNDGRMKERGYVHEYGFVANGYNYESLSRNDYVYADGSTYWQQNVYSDYDFSNNDCKRTNTWSNSDGGTGINVEGAHIVYCNEYNTIDPTCSQHGRRVHEHICQVCENITDKSEWDLEPTCHYWSWNNDKGVYVCTVCALESAVGSTGSICLEDLTEENSDVYIVGYWNRGYIKFTPVVSVILDDAADDDNELVLTGISFNYLTVHNDGVRALTFSKADAQSAAETAMTNVSYTGSYAIRISFVPVTATDTLDYAITFDSQNTAQ